MSDVNIRITTTEGATVITSTTGASHVVNDSASVQASVITSTDPAAEISTTSDGAAGVTIDDTFFEPTIASDLVELRTATGLLDTSTGLLQSSVTGLTGATGELFNLVTGLTGATGELSSSVTGLTGATGELSTATGILKTLSDNFDTSLNNTVNNKLDTNNPTATGFFSLDGVSGNKLAFLLNDGTARITPRNGVGLHLKTNATNNAAVSLKVEGTARVTHDLFKDSGQTNGFADNSNHFHDITTINQITQQGTGNNLNLERLQERYYAVTGNFVRLATGLQATDVFSIYPDSLCHGFEGVMDGNNTIQHSGLHLSIATGTGTHIVETGVTGQAAFLSKHRVARTIGTNDIVETNSNGDVIGSAVLNITGLVASSNRRANAQRFFVSNTTPLGKSEPLEINFNFDHPLKIGQNVRMNFSQSFEGPIVAASLFGTVSNTGSGNGVITPQTADIELFGGNYKTTNEVPANALDLTGLAHGWSLESLSNGTRLGREGVLSLQDKSYTGLPGGPRSYNELLHITFTGGQQHGLEQNETVTLITNGQDDLIVHQNAYVIDAHATGAPTGVFAITGTVTFQPNNLNTLSNFNSTLKPFLSGQILKSISNTTGFNINGSTVSVNTTEDHGLNVFDTVAINGLGNLPTDGASSPLDGTADTVRHLDGTFLVVDTPSAKNFKYLRVLGDAKDGNTLYQITGRGGAVGSTVSHYPNATALTSGSAAILSYGRLIRQHNLQTIEPQTGNWTIHRGSLDGIHNETLGDQLYTFFADNSGHYKSYQIGPGSQVDTHGIALGKSVYNNNYETIKIGYNTERTSPSLSLGPNQKSAICLESAQETFNITDDVDNIITSVSKTGLLVSTGITANGNILTNGNLKTNSTSDANAPNDDTASIRTPGGAAIEKSLRVGSHTAIYGPITGFANATITGISRFGNDLIVGTGNKALHVDVNNTRVGIGQKPRDYQRVPGGNEPLLDVNGSILASGNVSVQYNIDCGGDATLSNSVTIGGKTTIHSDLIVTGNITGAGTVTSTSSISRPIQNDETDSTPVRNVKTMTQSAYNSLGSKDANTLYIIL